jgi:hypothetical protein
MPEAIELEGKGYLLTKKTTANTTKMVKAKALQSTPDTSKG